MRACSGTQKSINLSIVFSISLLVYKMSENAKKNVDQRVKCRPQMFLIGPKPKIFSSLFEGSKESSKILRIVTETKTKTNRLID